jgi:hypothetical protein
VGGGGGAGNGGLNFEPPGAKKGWAEMLFGTNIHATAHIKINRRIMPIMSGWRGQIASLYGL